MNQEWQKTAKEWHDGEIMTLFLTHFSKYITEKYYLEPLVVRLSSRYSSFAWPEQGFYMHVFIKLEEKNRLTMRLLKGRLGITGTTLFMKEEEVVPFFYSKPASLGPIFFPQS